VQAGDGSAAEVKQDAAAVAESAPFLKASVRDSGHIMTTLSQVQYIEI
jgi:hypothetical protein